MDGKSVKGGKLKEKDKSGIPEVVGTGKNWKA